MVAGSRNANSCTTSPSDDRRSPIRLPDRRSALAALLVVLLLAPAGPAGALSGAWPVPPSIEFGELYRAVEMAGLFPDQKTFADAIPREPPAKVMADYDRQKRLPGFDLKTFVDRHFEPPHHFDVFRPGQDRNLPRLHRRLVGGVAAQARRIQTLFVALALGPPLRRPGQPVQ